MDTRAVIFALRSYTPIPLLIIILILAEPNLYTFITGALVAFMGESIRLWAVGYAGSATRTRHVGAPSLITNGPYSRVRNPIYLGNFILSLGLCIMAWAWMPYMLGIFLAAFGIQYGLIVSLEEMNLREIFKEEYETYLRSVPRFIPRITSYTVGIPAPYNFRAAIRSERRTFQSTAAVMGAIALRWYFS